MMLFCADSIYWGDFSGRVALQSDRLRSAQTAIDTLVAKKCLDMRRRMSPRSHWSAPLPLLVKPNSSYMLKVKKEILAPKK